MYLYVPYDYCNEIHYFPIHISDVSFSNKIALYSLRGMNIRFIKAEIHFIFYVFNYVSIYLRVYAKDN